jgi:hypothetical protein
MVVYKYMKNKMKAYLDACARKALLSISKEFASKIFCYHCGALCVPRGP